MSEWIRYDWDPKKAAANIDKQKIPFRTPGLFSRIDWHLPGQIPTAPASKMRWITIGQSSGKGLLLVVHTHVEIDDDAIYIRIISARKPTRHERRQYEQEAP